MTAPRLIVALAIALGVAAGARVAAADNASAECSYLEISATNAKAPAMDAELQPLQKKLKKPPFGSWNAFKKLSGGPVQLAKLKGKSLALAQGAASLLLRDRTDGTLQLTVSIDDADGKRVLDNKQSVAANDWIVWGHNVKDDGHILALTCK